MAPNFSVTLCHIVDRALLYCPENRYRDAAAMLRDLRICRDELRSACEVAAASFCLPTLVLMTDPVVSDVMTAVFEASATAVFEASATAVFEASATAVFEASATAVFEASATAVLEASATAVFEASATAVFEASATAVFEASATRSLLKKALEHTRLCPALLYAVPANRSAGELAA